MRCVLTRTSSCFLRQPPAVYCSLLVLSALRLASILLHTPLLFSSCRRCEVDRMGTLSRNRRSLEYSDLILLTPPQDRHSVIYSATRTNSAEFKFEAS